MFSNFEHGYCNTKEGKIFYRIGGKGPPLLLLHGYPQNHFMWYKTAPKLSKTFTVVIADLRGYGLSMSPKGDESHHNYSKRVMAKDMKTLMSHLGFEQFYLVGHDRGGRVAHRLARDNRNAVLMLMVLDICPTLDMYESTDMNFARAYFHWFFLIQKVGVPEKLIEANPEFWLQNCLNKWSTGHNFREVESEYIKTFRKPEKIHGSCEDYRAGATIDLEHDKKDRDLSLNIPIHVLWGNLGIIGKFYDPIKVWTKYTSAEVTGRGLSCGHFIPEERPTDTINEIQSFFLS